MADNCPPEVGETARKWREGLELRDWTIVVFCEADPDLKDTAEGTNEMVMEERTALIRIHPKAPDMAEVALHEMLHIWIQFVRQADSDVVDEQVVRILTRRLDEKEPVP